MLRKRILLTQAASPLLFLLPLLWLIAGCAPKRMLPVRTTGTTRPAAPVAADSLDLKIGQMILLGIGDRKALRPDDSLIRDLQSGKLGGIALFEKNIEPSSAASALRSLIADIQRQSPLPLFVTIDEEGGKVHRLKSKYGFIDVPSAAYLGRLDNPDTTLFHHRKLAVLLRSLGINLNYAPCVDVAVNADNPVIVRKERSFGADPELVARQAALVIRAHHEERVLTILKHFPGHGSSATDSHLGLTDVTQSWTAKELTPYRRLLADRSCDAIMTAHIVNGNLDSSRLPATLSAKIIGELLRDNMGFAGVVVSDDMQMHAISRNYGLENAIGLAINAGVDMLLFANNVTAAEPSYSAAAIHAAIKKLVLDGTIPRSRIDASFARIMRLKQRL